MQEVTTRKSGLGDAAVVHEERIFLESRLDSLKPGLLELPDFFSSAVLHNAKVASSGPVSLTVLRNLNGAFEAAQLRSGRLKRAGRHQWRSCCRTTPSSET